MKILRRQLLGTATASAKMSLFARTDVGSPRPCATLVFFLGVLIVPFCVPAAAENTSEDCDKEDQFASQTKIEAQQVVGGLRAPWGFAFLPDGDILFTKKEGTVWRIQRKVPDGPKMEYQYDPSFRQIGTVPGVFKKLRSDRAHQNRRYFLQGLLDIAVDPNFGKENRWVYLTFNECKDQICEALSHLTLIRARLADDKSALALEKERTEVIYSSTSDLHYDDGLPGGRVAFLKDNSLLLAVGFRHNKIASDKDPRRVESQNPCSDLGKILRLNPNRLTPPVSCQNQSQVFSLGHRDPQGLLVDPQTGRVWAHEHGPHGGDEINLIVQGNNYGFPVATKGLDYSLAKLPGSSQSVPGFEEPKYVWGAYTENNGRINPGASIAPSGFALNERDKGQNRYPSWKGHFFVGAMMAGMAAPNGDLVNGGSLRRLWSCKGGLTESRQKLLDGSGKDLTVATRIRDVRLGPDGYLYVLRYGFYDNESNGELLRLMPVTR